MLLKELAYYDGVYGTPEEVKIPFNDRVHFFGDGVYDATVGANGKVYLLNDHLDRFYSSAKALDIRIPMEKAGAGQPAHRPAGAGGRQHALCLLAGHPRRQRPQPCLR